MKLCNCRCVCDIIPPEKAYRKSIIQKLQEGPKTLPGWWGRQTIMHEQLLIWGPTCAFWQLLQYAEEYLPVTFAHCSRYDAERLEDPSKCWLNNILEDPRTLPFRIGFAGCFSVLFVLFATCRNKHKRLKSWTFWLFLPTVMLIQCLSSFSAGGQDQTVYGWDRNSPSRCLWILFLVDNPCWNRTYLGFYDDFYYDEWSQTVRNAEGDPVWRFEWFKQGALFPNSPAIHLPSFLPWRDIVVRMAHVYLIDNTIRLTWLRYCAEHVRHIGNSEVLTIILGCTLALYTYARTRTHVVFHANEKNDKPIAVRSASIDLLTLNSPYLSYRGSAIHCCTIMLLILTMIYILSVDKTSLKSLVGIPLMVISLWSVKVLISNEVGLTDHLRQKQRNPHINIDLPGLSAEDRWEFEHYARIRL